MSRLIGIDITLETLPSLEQFVDLLRAHDIKVGREDAVFFMSSEGDIDEWDIRPLCEMDEILARLSKVLQSGNRISLKVSWPDDLHRGNFLFFPDDSRISFIPDADSPTIGDTYIMALGWYLDTIISLLAPFGIIEHQAHDVP